MKKSKMILAAAAVILPLGIAGGSALAYFTANTTAAGGYAVEIGTNTEIHEDFSNWTKRITIENLAGGGAVYVRARAFSGSLYNLSYTDTTGWRDGGDGYWYYSDNNGILEPGKTTSELLVKITGMPEKEEDKKEAFNVIVIYERMPVKYDGSGNPIEPTAEDWAKYAVKEEEKGKLTGSDTGNTGSGTGSTDTGSTGGETGGADTGNTGGETGGADTGNTDGETGGTDAGNTGGEQNTPTTLTE